MLPVKRRESDALSSSRMVSCWPDCREASADSPDRRTDRRLTTAASPSEVGAPEIGIPDVEVGGAGAPAVGTPSPVASDIGTTVVGADAATVVGA